NPGPKDTSAADDRGRTRTDLDEAHRITEQMGAAAMARARRFAFDSNALDLAPGLRLDIGSHPMMERAGKLIVTQTTLSGAYDTEIHVSVGAAASDHPYRPDTS